MNATIRPRLTAIAAVAGALLAGCAASTTPQWDGSFGDSVRQLRAQQLIDAQAPQKNEGQPATADGRTVREAMDRHVETYRSPPPTNVINIGVGAGANGTR